jgi:hypothetical protein
MPRGGAGGDGRGRGCVAALACVAIGAKGTPPSGSIGVICSGILTPRGPGTCIQFSGARLRSLTAPLDVAPLAYSYSQVVHHAEANSEAEVTAPPFQTLESTGLLDRHRGSVREHLGKVQFVFPWWSI